MVWLSTAHAYYWIVLRVKFGLISYEDLPALSCTVVATYIATYLMILKLFNWSHIKTPIGKVSITAFLFIRTKPTCAALRIYNSPISMIPISNFPCWYPTHIPEQWIHSALGNHSVYSALVYCSSIQLLHFSIKHARFSITSQWYN